MAYCSKGRVCITLKKTSQLKAPAQITPTENFGLAEAIESVYPLLEIVFSYLDYKDLQNVAQVKKSWELAARKVLQGRNELSWITVFRKKRQSYVYYSDNYPYSNVELGIILFNYRAVSLSDFFCCHENLSQKKIKFSEFLAEQVVPYGIDYCVIGCPGVSSMFSKTVVNKCSVPLFDSCFIPAIPNVRMSMFYCNHIHMRDDYIGPTERIRCLLLFCKSDLEDNIYTIFDRLLANHDHRNVAIGGGIVRRTVLFPQTSQSFKFRRHTNLCIAFTEDICNESTFNSSSVVISGNNLTSEQFQTQLSEFKQKIILRTNSLAFKICCSAKMKKSHESKVFNQLFPNTPLLGLEAEGEIGWDCFNVTEDTEEVSKAKKARSGYPIAQHQWSTVIVVITWGHVINTQ